MLLKILHILLIHILLSPIVCRSQNTIGLPDITNYSKIDYNAGLQNWDFKQDKNGIIYVANNEGLLTFDGKYWKTYPLPNKTIVRSLEISNDNKIYVGGQDELGYFSQTTNGQLAYHSLLKFIKEADKDFADVWDIVSTKNEVFFRTSRRIFKFSNNTISVYHAPTEWSYLGSCNGKIFAHDIQKGLLRFANNEWQAVEGTSLLINTEITSILLLKNSIIITTLKNGIFNYSNNQLTKIVSATTLKIEKQSIYAATAIQNKWIGLATNDAGVFIIDEKGDLIQSFSKIEGLQNNNILNIFYDKQGNLWLGLINGIDCIGFNNAIKIINPFFENTSTYSTALYHDKLYVGTSNGLFSAPIGNNSDISFARGDFSAVAGTSGQVWNLAEINNKLFLAHHEGAFTINENQSELISKINGFWNFQAMSNTQLVAGNYKGLAYLNQKGNDFEISNVSSKFTQTSRFVAIDDATNLWVSHPFHGVYKVPKDSNINEVIKIYNEKNGLPSGLNNHIYKIKDEILVATEKGIYVYNVPKDIFEPSTYYQELLGTQSIRYLKADKEGNLWFIHEKILGVVDMSAKTPHIIYIPELNNKILSGFEFVYPVDEGNIFIGGENGLYNLNFKKYKKTNYDLKVHLSEVSISGSNDSLLFGGYFNNINEKQEQQKENFPKIAHSWQLIHFEFSTPIFGTKKNLEYSYRLKGLETNWSKWSNKTEKDYTNLPAGKYVFEIKVRDNLEEESEQISYTFTILPPWYLSQLAYVVYLLCIILIIFLIIKWQGNKFLVQQIKYEDEQNQLNYLKQLEIDKAQNMLTKIKNEKLQVEIDSKNSELINFTMHLVQKGELLSNLKSHMSKVTKVINNTMAQDEFKKIIKVLNDAEKMDNDWENFTNHFDKAYNLFTINLKEKFPKLTANDLKICTFLRMNLSTKEIAQLMNISMRGIELSRYRLRKKLNISTEVSLFDFLNEI
jgi:ligand-binding sensor domain-containing protein